jgi:peptidoglycan/LPS O-acetylase OafA/YrhL
MAALDILRFLAAFGVMIYHYTYYQNIEPSAFQSLSLHGYLGVNLFFMISGFVVLWSARGRTPLGFAHARVLRLYPEFWISVLLAAAVYSVCRQIPGREIGWRTLLLNLTMVPQFFGADYVDNVYWTLFPELKFYAMLWLLLVIGQMRNIERWLAGWLVVDAILFASGHNGAIASLVIHPFAPLFIAGCLFFLVYDSGWTRPRLLGILVCLALSAHQAVAQMPGFVAVEHINGARRLETVGLIIAFFIIFGTLTLRSLALASSKWMVQVGLLTYPLYLLHNSGRAIFISDPQADSYWLSVSIAIAFSLVLSGIVVQVARRMVKPPLRRLLDATSPATRLAMALGSATRPRD